MAATPLIPPMPREAQAVGSRQLVARRLSQPLTYILLTLGAVLMLMPYAWMLATSLKTGPESFTASFFPREPTLEAYREAWSGERIQSEFPRWYVNSLFVTGVSVVSALIFCSLGGYAFSRYRFPGRTVLLILVISTIMIPTEMLILPWFQIMVDLKWVDTFQGLLWPHLVHGFGIFMMKQFIDGVPEELLDAARVDGMSEFGIFWRIVLPLVKPALAALAILTFLGTWNDFLWPVIVTTDIQMWTVAMGIGSYTAQLATEWNLQMAAATVASVPVILIFIFFQRQIIEGISLTGMRG
jgi:multiple sugar transport system permease protein